MSRKDEAIPLGAAHLGCADLLALSRGEVRGSIGEDELADVDQSRAQVAELAGGAPPVYGINTGFGPLCTTRVSAKDTRALQLNLLRSHASGTGEPISLELSRLMLALKLHALALGHSGVRRETLERILWHLEANVVPVVPSQGSVGASGDLAPLAHCFLPLVGEGKVWCDGHAIPAADALRDAGLARLELGPKEGLALINGTQFIAAHALLALERMERALELADVAGALSLEGLLGSTRPFTRELHELRPHAGARYVAWNLRRLLAGSEVVASHASCERVQDPYSLRCMPQVHGASRAAWRHLFETVTCEINSVTDNPVILHGGEAISGGNFHGQPLALPVDYATLAASELGAISDRRTYLLLEGSREGVPALLVPEAGLHSGFMILQYTSAALASENKGLCFPASADSIPTSLGQEDHVSMGSIGSRKLHRVLENLEGILAVELLCAAQAIDFRRPLRMGPVLEAVHARLREAVPFATGDRAFGEDLAVVEALVRSGELLAAAAAVKTTGFDEEPPAGFEFV